MHRVKLDDAQRLLPELAERAERGEEVVISRGDGADFRLVPIVAPHPPRKGGGARGLLTVPDDFDAPLADFEPYTR